MIFHYMKVNVISEIFARTLFSRNFAFVKNKPSRNGKISLSFIYIGKSTLVANFYITNMSFNAIRENEILAKISESTVLHGTA